MTLSGASGGSNATGSTATKSLTHCASRKCERRGSLNRTSTKPEAGELAVTAPPMMAFPMGHLTCRAIWPANSWSVRHRGVQPFPPWPRVKSTSSTLLPPERRLTGWSNLRRDPPLPHSPVSPHELPAGVESNVTSCQRCWIPFAARLDGERVLTRFTVVVIVRWSDGTRPES